MKCHAGTSFTLSCCCSVSKLCRAFCDPMDCSTSGFPVLHHPGICLPTHIHWVGDAIQPSHPLLSPSPPALNLSQHQCLFPWLGSSHQIAKVLQLQLQHPACFSIPANEYSGSISLRLTGLISLLSKGLSRVFSNTIVQMHQFFGALPSSWSNSHIHTWLLEKP